MSCEKDGCESKELVLEVQFSVVPPELGSSVRSLVVEMVAGGQGRRMAIDTPQGIKVGGESIGILLDSDLPLAGPVSLHVRAVQGEMGNGSIVAEGSQEFVVERDACNVVSVSLLQTNIPSPSCFAKPSNSTVFLFEFEDQASDTLGRFQGTIVGRGLSYSQSIPDCGLALQFPDSPQAQAYVEVPHADAFSVPEGRLSLRMQRGTGTDDAVSVVSKDAPGSNAGDLGIYIACDGTVVVKTEAGGDSAGDRFVCSARQVAPNAWGQVELLFSSDGARLRVDGDETVRTGDVGLFGKRCRDRVVCSSLDGASLVGNGHSWLLGAGVIEGDPELPFQGGIIDNFELRNSTVN